MVFTFIPTTKEITIPAKEEEKEKEEEEEGEKKEEEEKVNPPLTLPPNYKTFPQVG